jgi:hypothetical protein
MCSFTHAGSLLIFEVVFQFIGNFPIILEDFLSQRKNSCDTGRLTPIYNYLQGYSKTSINPGRTQVTHKK